MGPSVPRPGGPHADPCPQPPGAREWSWHQTKVWRWASRGYLLSYGSAFAQSQKIPPQPIRRPLQLLGPPPHAHWGSGHPLSGCLCGAAVTLYGSGQGLPQVPAQSVRLGRCCRLPWELPSCRSVSARVTASGSHCGGDQGQRLPLELPLGCEAPCLASHPGRSHCRATEARLPCPKLGDPQRSPQLQAPRGAR